MKTLLLSLLVLGASAALAQSAFDGTWRLNTQSAQIKANDKFSLENGMYRCDTCVPKIAVKADGQDQKVSGSPYLDTLSVTVVNDRSVETNGKKAGKHSGTTKMTASEDGKTLTTDWSFISESGQEAHGRFTSERVGEEVAGANKVSGEWHPNKIEDASDSAKDFTFKVTADEISMNDPTGDSYTAKFDGKDYPYKGDPGTTSVTVRKIDANTIEETDKRNGKVISVARMTVDPDGKTMKLAIQDKLRNASYDWIADKQ
jgi:hypothetical protein